MTPFITAGAFPVFNTDLNFATNQPEKFKSSDKWLYAGQVGADWKISKSFNFKFGAAYYHFDNVEGQLSDPFIPLLASDQGNTDNSRPSFAQKGNTYRPLRRIIPSPLNNFGTTNQFQYFGLATPFHELALTARLDINHWEPFQISLIGEWVKNLAFDAKDIDLIAVNNRGADTSAGATGRFGGAPNATSRISTSPPQISARYAALASSRFGRRTTSTPVAKLSDCPGATQVFCVMLVCAAMSPDM